MLYIFAMIVFIVIRRKQKKDRRLREQFLQVPAPEGIGFKSSRYDCYIQGDPFDSSSGMWVKWDFFGCLL